MDRFQGKKVLQTAQIMNNIRGQEKDGNLVAIETVTFQIRNSEKYLFGVNHSNYAVKTEFS